MTALHHTDRACLLPPPLSQSDVGSREWGNTFQGELTHAHFHTLLHLHTKQGFSLGDEPLREELVLLPGQRFHTLKVRPGQSAHPIVSILKLFLGGVGVLFSLIRAPSQRARSLFVALHFT